MLSEADVTIVLPSLVLFLRGAVSEFPTFSFMSAGVLVSLDVLGNGQLLA